MLQETNQNLSSHEAYDRGGPLIVFQLNVARRWLRRGENTEDSDAQFFFYYTGLNALYFLWAKIDGLTNEQGEGKQIEHLVGKFGEETCKAILDSIMSSVQFFVRRQPIQEMRTRDATREAGKVKEGKKFRNRLHTVDTEVERLRALTQIIYLVRCNLFHGGKAESGDDRKIVTNSVPVLKVLLREAITLTEGNS